MGTHKCSSSWNAATFWFHSVWLAAFPAYEFASRSCWYLLSWKRGHIRILRETLSGETPRYIYISHLKSIHIPNKDWLTGKTNGKALYLSRPNSRSYLLVTSTAGESTEQHQIPNTALAGSCGQKVSFQKAGCSKGLAPHFFFHSESWTKWWPTIPRQGLLATPACQAMSETPWVAYAKWLPLCLFLAALFIDNITTLLRHHEHHKYVLLTQSFLS